MPKTTQNIFNDVIEFLKEALAELEDGGNNHAKNAEISHIKATSLFFGSLLDKEINKLFGQFPALSELLRKSPDVWDGNDIEKVKAL